MRAFSTPSSAARTSAGFHPSAVTAAIPAALLRTARRLSFPTDMSSSLFVISRFGGFGVPSQFPIRSILRPSAPVKQGPHSNKIPRTGNLPIARQNAFLTLIGVEAAFEDEIRRRGTHAGPGIHPGFPALARKAVGMA